MPTSFEQIYCLNTVIKKDTLLSRLPIYQYYSLCYRQLQYAITAFMYYCLKDITKYTPYSEQEFNFISDGVEVVYDIPDEINPLNTFIYVGYMGVDDSYYIEILDFTLDILNKTVTLNEALPKDTKVIIAFYNIGEFEAILEIDEKTILSEGMNIPFLEAFQNNERSLNQIIYTKSYSIHSQAEQLKQLSIISSAQWKDRVEALIIKYSFNKPKDLSKLGGRGKM